MAAVDLGASSGRIMAVTIGPERLELVEAHRFTNEPVRAQGRLEWDWPRIVSEVRHGLRSADADGGLDAIGIDSWGVDYGLLDERGELLGNPVHYRDRRTRNMPGRARHLVDDAGFYAITGTQFQPFNTAYQVLAELQDGGRAARATKMLLIPDLLTYHLTGIACAERTNASTTQLFDMATQDWSTHLVDRLGIPRGWLPDMHEPGTVIGRLRPAYADICSDPMVVSVASHDTASAVAAVPAEGDGFAYISCGTWSLVGVELEVPIHSEESRHANFTNELGLDRTVRYLRNVMGLWLLQQSECTWRARGLAVDTASLIESAEAIAPCTWVIDPDDPRLLEPGDMPARIGELCAEAGEVPPHTPAEVTRCILDSLVLAYRRAIDDAVRMTGQPVEVIHVVGGGSRNRLLCQSTADATGLPVVAGPTEAAALGNALVQARALGVIDGNRWALRRLVRETQPLEVFSPRGDARWARSP